MVGRRMTRLVLGALVALAAVGLAPGAPAGAEPVRAKELTLAVSPAAPVWSQSTRLALTIVPRGGGAPKGGTVTFYDGDAPIGTAVATTRITSITTTTLAPGEHTIRADYGGDATTAPGSSAPVTVTVAPAPTSTVVTSRSGPVSTGERAELRAVVRAVAPAATGRRPTGTVTFTTGTTSRTVALNASGFATWTPRLGEGTHSVTATYDGSPNHATSTSEPTEQVVATESRLDQQQLTEGDANTYFVGNLGMIDTAAFQTFTAGRTGLLDAVELYGGPESFQIAVHAVDAQGRPKGAALGGVLTGSAPFPYRYELATPAPVQKGKTYAIVLTTDYSVSSGGFYGTRTDSYARGHAGVRMWSEEEGWHWAPAAGDLYFRTWVRS